MGRLAAAFAPQLGEAFRELDDETKELNRLRAANDGASKEDVKALLGLGPLHAYRDALLGAEKPVEGSKEATEAGGLHWYHGMTKGKGFYSELTGSPEEGEGGGGGGRSQDAGIAATRCLPRPMATEREAQRRKVEQEQAETLRRHRGTHAAEVMRLAPVGAASIGEALTSARMSRYEPKACRTKMS